MAPAEYSDTNNIALRANPTMEKLLGRYESILLRTTKPGRSLYQLDKGIYSFLYLFPRTSDPCDFTVFDVERYIKIRIRRGDDDSAIIRDLNFLRAFWDFLIEYLDFHCTNPFSRRTVSKWQKKRLSEQLGPRPASRLPNIERLLGGPNEIDTVDKAELTPPLESA